MPVPGGLDAIITLEDAKAQLNTTSTAHDTELLDYVDSVAEDLGVIERYVGAVVQREVTEVVSANADLTAVRLLTTPVVSVTSMVQLADGVTAYPVAELYVANALAGIVRRRDGYAILGGPWTTVYQAGRAAVPASVNMAARMLVQHLWQTQRGLAGAPRVAGSEPAVEIPGIGYAVPNRVLELLQAKRLPPMVA